MEQLLHFGNKPANAKLILPSQKKFGRGEMLEASLESDGFSKGWVIHTFSSVSPNGQNETSVVCTVVEAKRAELSPSSPAHELPMDTWLALVQVVLKRGGRSSILAHN